MIWKQGSRKGPSDLVCVCGGGGGGGGWGWGWGGGVEGNGQSLAKKQFFSASPYILFITFLPGSIMQYSFYNFSTLTPTGSNGWFLKSLYFWRHP